MESLLERLDAIAAIVDTVSPSQIENDPQGVISRYELYASTYLELDRVKALRDRVLAEIHKGKPVNGYLSADYGYGKTATLVYLWHECQENQIVAVPPFKFKELGSLIVATYGWIKAILKPSHSSKLLTRFEALYRECGLKSIAEQAAEIARKYKVSEEKALHIVRELKTDTRDTDSVLNFWQESVSILREADFAGLAIFADESQEFLRTEEGSSARIQILSDLVKGMRALGSTPVALILSMPTTPTESAIEEQAGDIIHRMQEQKVSLRLADAYNSEFPGKLWDFLCKKFPKDELLLNQLVHRATIESLGQLCDRKDLSNGPRTVIEVFKRIAQFIQEKGQAYTPLNLIEDYLEGRVQFYGTQQHKISDLINKVELLISHPQHPQGREVIKLLASFPSGVSETVASVFGLAESLKKLAEDDNFYGLHIIQPTENSFALVALLQTTPPTVIDKILGSFRRCWFGDWNDAQKEEMATTIFRQEILSLLLPVSRSGQKANWTWRYKDDWKQDRFGFYNFLNGAPERYNSEFPNRSLVISVGRENSGLMRFSPPEETHLDWRFYLSYERNAANRPQRLTAIAGTGQVDFHLQLGRTFEGEYPASFSLLRKVMTSDKCSVCTLLNLSHYIQDWLLKYPEVSKGDRDQLEHHRQNCHSLAMRLLFPIAETWEIVGLKGVNGTENKLIESAFYKKCQALFPQYHSFYTNLRPALLKYKLALERVPLAERRGRQLYQAPKEEFEKLFDTAGSGLPSLLAIFKQYSLISDWKVAGNKQENSHVEFTQHPLESWMQDKLRSPYSRQMSETERQQQDVQGVNHAELWEEVKKIGYLKEEFEEAIEWLQRRRYVEWERQKGIIRLRVQELDSDDLKGQLNELRTQVSSLLEAFDQTLLHEVARHIDEAEKILANVATSQGAFNTTGDMQLTLKLDSVGFSQDFANLHDEGSLDRVQQTIQTNRELLEEFSREKRSALQKKLGEIKFKLENLTRNLKDSKVSQIILGTSGLEVCLDEHRKNLERQANQLDKDCQNLASSIVLNEPNILTLHRQREQCNQSLQSHESNKKRLEDLVAGLEQWRIILTRAGTLRDNLTNDPDRLMRYNDEFVDRVVAHFDTHQIESFREYALLKCPLEEIEEQIRSDRRSRREAFEQMLSQYEALLGRIAPQISHLGNRCRFDDENQKGSYETLRQVFLEKVQNWCDRALSEWEKLEGDLSFLARERDVTELLNQVSRLKTNLGDRRTELPVLIENIEALEECIAQLQFLAEKSQELRGEYLRLQVHKDENIAAEEKQLLDEIDSRENGVTISQLRQLASENQDIWELVKTLHQKGYLEITLYRRN